MSKLHELTIRYKVLKTVLCNHKAESWGRIVIFCCNESVAILHTPMMQSEASKSGQLRKKFPLQLSCWCCSISFNGLNWDSCSSTIVCICKKVEELHSHVKLRACPIYWRCGSVESVFWESNSQVKLTSRKYQKYPKWIHHKIWNG